MHVGFPLLKLIRRYDSVTLSVIELRPVLHNGLCIARFSLFRCGACFLTTA